MFIEYFPSGQVLRQCQLKEKEKKERSFISVSSRSSAGALIGETVN